MSSTSIQLHRPSAASGPQRPEVTARVFERLHARYGTKWADLWRGQAIDDVMAEWSRGMAGLSLQQIADGLAAFCSDWPPTMPEFVRACAPPIDIEVAYYEAQAYMSARSRGEDRRLSHPALFWAAAELGGDIALPYRPMRARWVAALNAVLQAGEIPPPPPRPAALITHTHTSTRPPPEARRRLADALAGMRSGALRSAISAAVGVEPFEEEAPK